MEVVTDSEVSTPVLLPNAILMEVLEKDVKDSKEHLAKYKRKQKQRGRNNNRNNDDNIKSKYEHRDWIQEHVLEYLKSTPCVNIPTSKLIELKSKCMSTKKTSPKKKLLRKQPQDIQSAPIDDATATKSATELSTSVSLGYGLTEAEAVQILNFMPEQPVEIHLMIEDLHARMSETKQEEFLDMIRSYNTSMTINDNDDDNNDDVNRKEPTEDIVDDSIEMLETAGNLTLNDHNNGDTGVMIKEEI